MDQTLKVLCPVLILFLITACGESIKELPTDMKIPENPISACPDSPNCFRITQVFEQDSSVVFEAFESTLSNEAPFEVDVSQSDQVHSISAVYKIPVFGWLDDVKIVFESHQENKNRTFVHLKSSSREGYSDLGVNKRRINRILKKARKELNP